MLITRVLKSSAWVAAKVTNFCCRSIPVIKMPVLSFAISESGVELTFDTLSPQPRRVPCPFEREQNQTFIECPDLLHPVPKADLLLPNEYFLGPPLFEQR